MNDLRRRGYTGLHYHGEREHPYSVWVRGWIVGWAATEEDGQRRLIRELNHIKRNRRN